MRTVPQGTLPEPIELGDEVRDTLTGYSGLVTGRTSFLYASGTALVVPRERKDDGLPNVGAWIDVERLERLKLEVPS